LSQKQPSEADEAQAWFESARGSATEEDVTQAEARAAEAEAKVREVGPLRRHLERVRLMVMMLRDWRARRYPEASWKTVAAVAAMVLYLVNPFDLIPDFIPGIGYADDLAVVALCWAVTRKDLEAYAAWKLAQACCPEAEVETARKAFPHLAR
jgi:uncharacterized membrane protein YkvA (DUF1232 family)